MTESESILNALIAADERQRDTSLEDALYFIHAVLGTLPQHDAHVDARAAHRCVARRALR